MRSENKTCSIKTQGAGSAAFVVNVYNKSFLGKWPHKDRIYFCHKHYYCLLYQRQCDE
jgi:hypothetical protein